MQEMHECNGNEEGNCGGSCEHQHRCQPHGEMHECDQDRGDDGAQGEHQHHDQPLGGNARRKRELQLPWVQLEGGGEEGSQLNLLLVKNNQEPCRCHNVTCDNVTMLHKTISEGYM